MQLAMDKILYYNNKPLQGSPSAVIYLLVEVQYRTMSRSPIRLLYNLPSVIFCLMSSITSSSGRFLPSFTAALVKNETPLNRLTHNIENP